MDSLNKNPQSAYLTMQAATKESLMPPVTLALREQCIHWAIFSTALFSIPKTKIVQKFKKTPKGIDKIRTRFIMKWWGKVGKKGKKSIT
jgi:hypothetical protein